MDDKEVKTVSDSIEIEVDALRQLASKVRTGNFSNESLAQDMEDIVENLSEEVSVLRGEPRGEDEEDEEDDENGGG